MESRQRNYQWTTRKASISQNTGKSTQMVAQPLFGNPLTSSKNQSHKRGWPRTPNKSVNPGPEVNKYLREKTLEKRTSKKDDTGNTDTGAQRKNPPSQRPHPIVRLPPRNTHQPDPPSQPLDPPNTKPQQGAPRSGLLQIIQIIYQTPN